MYRKACASFWVTSEVDLSGDKAQFESLTKAERTLILEVLAFFAASDGIVNENLVCQFYQEVEEQEARQFYAIQIGVEAIHSEMYSILIDTYVSDSQQKLDLFNAIETHPAIKAKADFAFKYMDKSMPLSVRLVAYACTEGILFSASFATIYYFKKRGLMPGLTLSNEFISRDEGLHADFSCLVYQHKFMPLEESVIHEIVNDAVEAELAFVDSCLTGSVIGLSNESLKEYVRFISDRLLVQLDCSKVYNLKNPLEYMDIQSLQTKTNFFESRVSEYSRGMKGDLGDFCLDMEF